MNTNTTHPYPHSLITGAKRAVAALIVTATLASMSPTPAFGQSVSELLEKGIYSEETTGDIDAAIQLYQQVITEGKAAQSLAAEALYRLGACYVKKNNHAEATATFERLAKEYPDQKELIAKAQQYLPTDLALLPVPWTDGEALQFRFVLQSGFTIGAAVYTANFADVDGKKIWRVGARMLAGAQSLSQVDAEAETFRPIGSRWRHGLLGDARATYREGQVEVTYKGKTEPVIVTTEGVVYDNEQAVHVMRRLPLALGYKATLPIISSLGPATTIPIGLEVLAIESVVVPAGTFECFKCELSIKQTFWISTQPKRYVAKFEAGGATAELTEILSNSPRKPRLVRNETLGITFKSPPGWFVQSRPSKDSKPELETMLLDPDSPEAIFVEVNALDSLKESDRNSLQAWAERKMDDISRQFNAFKLRPEGWTNSTIGGYQALGFVADYLDGMTKRVVAGTFVLGGTTANRFIMTSEQEAFATLKPHYDSVLASFTTH